MNASDAPAEPARASWVPVPADSDFPLENLPFGAFARADATAPRLGVAIGAAILDLHVVERAGLFDRTFPGATETLAAPNLNPLLARGQTVWRALRARLGELLREGNTELHDARIAGRAFCAQAEVTMALPVAVGDYVDFYASLEHASNVGRILRPDAEPLLPNWRWLPVGYHGRAGSIVPSGTPIVRPCGQSKAPGAQTPSFGPTRMLDFELELAFVTGDGPVSAAPVTPSRAREHIFGAVLLNDWSARDIQAWEYQPLGPFLGKSFATSLAPWVVTLEALEPYRVAGPQQEPRALPNLAADGAQGYDIALEVTLASERMRREGIAPRTVTRTNFRSMYWSMAQQLAHATSNGARVRAGDLFGSGTISGSEPESCGSMIELTWRGEKPLALPDGTARSFLEDGDEVTMRARCAGPGRPRIGFGEVSGIVRPARDAARTTASR